MESIYNVPNHPGWATPHKVSNSDTNLKHKNIYKCTNSYKIIIENMHAAYEGKPMKKKSINNNATPELKHN
jgi:hypothetical protein